MYVCKVPNSLNFLFCSKLQQLTILFEVKRKTQEHIASNAFFAISLCKYANNIQNTIVFSILYLQNYCYFCSNIYNWYKYFQQSFDLTTTNQLRGHTALNLVLRLFITIAQLSDESRDACLSVSQFVSPSLQILNN